jgi:hypothetical protein
VNLPQRNGHPTSTGVRPLDDPAARPAPQDGLLALGRALLYPGLALTSLLLFRGPGSLPIGDILMAGAGFCAVLSMHRPPRRLPPALLVAGALLIIGVALASSVSSDMMGSMSTGARLIYMVVIVPWILLMLLTEQRHVTRAVSWWLGGAALCGLGAIAQMTLGDVIPGGQIRVDGRLTGITTHPNDLAGISVMAAAAALAALGHNVPKRFRRFALIILAISTVGLILSGSVSGFFGLAAAVIFLIARGAIHLGRATVVAAVGALVVGYVVSQIETLGGLNPIERLMRTTGFSATTSEYDTAATRFELARRAVGAIQEHPITGYGMLIKDNILMKSFTVHNNFLGAWTAGGILVFLGVVIATLLAVVYCFRHDKGDPLHNILATSVVAALVFAQTAPGIYNRYYWIPIAFAIFLAWRSRLRAAPPTV